MNCKARTVYVKMRLLPVEVPRPSWWPWGWDLVVGIRVAPDEDLHGAVGKRIVRAAERDTARSLVMRLHESDGTQESPHVVEVCRRSEKDGSGWIDLYDAIDAVYPKPKTTEYYRVGFEGGRALPDVPMDVVQLARASSTHYPLAAKRRQGEPPEDAVLRSVRSRLPKGVARTLTMRVVEGKGTIERPHRVMVDVPIK